MRRHARRAVALVAALLAACAPAPATELLGSHRWVPPWHGAGGYSALWVDGTGTAFLTLSDRGGWVRGVLNRDPSGAVASVAVTGRGTLARQAGPRPEGNDRDVEGLAVVGGTAFVSYESADRVLRHDTLDGPPLMLPLHPDWEGFGVNSGLEALAAAPDGTLYAIPERSGARGAPFPVYRYDGTAWDIPFTIPRDGPFLVTGADIGPDGRLYVLERDFALVGFRSRLRSVALDGTDERVEFTTTLRRHDNLEGLAVWRDAAGRLRATMISDDNLRPVQVTEFVDYVLSPPGAEATGGL